ncbi:unnamed protein product [Brassica napus]|nr:unnamed protein product [Brassica napus]
MEAWDEEVRDDWTKKDLKIWFGVNRLDSDDDEDDSEKEKEINTLKIFS